MRFSASATHETPHQLSRAQVFLSKAFSFAWWLRLGRIRILEDHGFDQCLVVRGQTNREWFSLIE
jgi:hypothetical protein